MYSFYCFVLLSYVFFGIRVLRSPLLWFRVVNVKTFDLYLLLDF